jgi:hypothetical protein
MVLAVSILMLAREEARALDLPIHAGLEPVQTLALRFHLIDVGQLGPNGDGILMRGIARQPELFAVIGFKNESHRMVLSGMVNPGGTLGSGMKRPQAAECWIARAAGPSAMKRTDVLFKYL